MGGGIRSQDRQSQTAYEANQAAATKAYDTGNPAVGHTSPLRKRSYGSGQTAMRTDYSSLGARPYGSYNTVEAYETANRPPIDPYRQQSQTIDVKKSEPLRRSKSRSKSPPRYD